MIEGRILMIKKASVILLLLFLPMSLPAFQVEVGALYGLRTVFDSDVKDVYGDGMVYYPYLTVDIGGGLYIGAGYEGGYEKSGTIGLFDEATTIKVTGIEVFAGYQLKLRRVVPYFRAGYGIYYYQQTVDSPYVEDYKVDHRGYAPFVSGGLKIYFSRNIFLSGDVKYVPLKVKPFQEEVDLSGLRILGGIGFSF